MKDSFKEATGIAIPPAPAPSEEANWSKHKKGMTGIIYKHPRLERAIVSGPNGIFYNGKQFPNLDAAKSAALALIQAPSEGGDDANSRF
jgi:hypothetical protein